MKTVVPYKEKEEGKKEQVQAMFDNIAHKYDFLNHFLSLGIDITWRKKLIKLLEKDKPQKIADIATGTADVAIMMAKMLKPQKIVGIDLSAQMLEEGRKKIKQENLSQIIELAQGDSEKLLLNTNEFDAVTVAFGVRNFENLEKGLAEIYRVLKPGGTAAILEFSKPDSFPFKYLYNFYFKYILPMLGRLISKDTSAYTYLPESVQSFPQGKEFLLILNKIGFKNTQWTSLTFGVSSIYIAQKPSL